MSTTLGAVLMFIVMLLLLAVGVAIQIMEAIDRTKKKRWLKGEGSTGWSTGRDKVTGDEMRLTILDDGTLKIETDEISSKHHIGAENMLGFLGELMGGKEKRVKRKDAHHQQSQQQQTIKYQL
jgi:hypothetical protein